MSFNSLFSFKSAGCAAHCKEKSSFYFRKTQSLALIVKRNGWIWPRTRECRQVKRCVVLATTRMNTLWQSVHVRLNNEIYEKSIHSKTAHSFRFLKIWLRFLPAQESQPVYYMPAHARRVYSFLSFPAVSPVHILYTFEYGCKPCTITLGVYRGWQLSDGNTVVTVYILCVGVKACDCFWANSCDHIIALAQAESGLTTPQ